MLKVGEVKEIYEMKGAGRSVRGIAGELGIARNTVRRYLKSPEAIRAKPRPQRASKLYPYTGYVDHRLDEGLENCVVLHRELRARGYDGGYSILKAYVSPKRRPRQPDATMRFETAPGEQAQVDWGKPGLHWSGRAQAPHLGVRDDLGLVPGLLRGAGPEGGYRRLFSVNYSCRFTPCSWFRF